jgi:hypothetical protein
VYEDSEDWRLALPPRRIAGAGEGETLYLIPAEPSAYVARKTGTGAWDTVVEDLPGWVTDAAIVGPNLYLVGASGGRFVESQRAWP